MPFVPNFGTLIDPEQNQLDRGISLLKCRHGAQEHAPPKGWAHPNLELSGNSGAARLGSDDRYPCASTAGCARRRRVRTRIRSKQLDRIVAPKNAPVDIIEKLNAVICAALADPSIKTRLADLGAATLARSSSDFGKLITDETEKWAKVSRTANIKAG